MLPLPPGRRHHSEARERSLNKAASSQTGQAIGQLLAQAMGLHQAGRHGEAAALFRQVLALQPKQLDALNLLGIIHALQGDFAEALRLIGRSLKLRPQQPHALNYLGYARHGAGQYQEALAAYNRAIALKPDFADAYSNRGGTLRQLGRHAEALASYERAITLHPGLVHAHCNRAAVLQDLGRCNEAVSAYEKVIALEPGNAEAHNDLGAALLELGRFEPALSSIERALALNPGLFGALVNRGNALNQLQRFDQALESYDDALAMNPGSAQLHSNRGHLLHDAGRYQEALHNYDRALGLDPALALVQWNKGLIKLLFGDFEEGWRLYESRWRSYAQAAYRNFPQPLWLGREPLQGRTILLHAEQGLGDTIQFCRYLPAVQALGAEVVLEAPATLLPLLASLPGRYRLIAAGDPLPDFDLQCPLMSLPLACASGLYSVPAQVPYLAADQGRQGEWRQRLGPRLKTRVGLAWSGSARHLDDRQRSMALRSLGPLLGLDVEFHCLQQEIGAEDQAALVNFPQVRCHQAGLRDFSDTAALVTAMDLVISVDTAVAHLAGALAKPVWILLPHAPDFRWMLGRSDSPWYPTARLFRQTSRGEWSPVVAEVCAALRRGVDE